MRQNTVENKGQSLIEALFVVVFTTIIMFAFIQICIIAVDDMIANEAAFVAMRSAAVTRNKRRSEEAEKRTKNYLKFFYPFSGFGTSNFNPSHFVLSDKKTVEKYFKESDKHEEDDSKEIFTDTDPSDPENKSVRIWKGKKTARDHSGKIIAKETVKIYYFTRVLFGSLVSKDNSFKNRRYQSARNRMVPSPDEEYYYKAFPGAKEFEKN
ncbi:MAG: hypothetical protein LBN01_02860 [Endomicrobium sp.]|jgi:hypothetical protein|nr:hypothetical protein [Endomicrobium sp.]